MDLLEREYLSTHHETRPVDLAEKTQFFGLDAIGDIALGAPMGYLEGNEDVFDYNLIVNKHMILMNTMSALPWLARLAHKWPFKLMAPKEGDRNGFGKLIRFELFQGL